jgi:hypothetical protein
MKTYAMVIGLAFCSVLAESQVAAPEATRIQPSGMTAPQPALTELNPLLTQVEQSARAMNLEISRLRIEKWKADATTKRRSQEKADSISRNLTAALPAIVDQVRANPHSLAATFKLYRNLDALYDVFSSLTESAGAFGPKSEYQELAGSAANLDKIRRNFGDKLESLAANSDTEIVRLRTEIAQAKAAPPPPPKKIIVDDEEKPKKPVKKSTKKPAPAPAPASSDKQQ